MKLNIMAIGDIVGRPGRRIVVEKLRAFREKEQIHFVVANGENLAGGSGITPPEADDLFKSGVDVITCGDHVWAKREIVPYIASTPRLLRPANYPESNPGKGHVLVDTPYGKIGVIHVVGRVLMTSAHADCPFRIAERLAKELRLQTKMIVVDMHCEATSEKVAMGWHLNGQVSLVFGTHTHIQTADERVLPNGGTAYITDCGMTGPYESIIGRRIDRVLHRFVTQMPAPFDVAEGDVRLCGCVASVDSDSGLAQSIRRVVIFDKGEVRF